MKQCAGIWFNSFLLLVTSASLLVTSVCLLLVAMHLLLVAESVSVNVVVIPRGKPEVEELPPGIYECRSKLEAVDQRHIPC